MGREGELDPVRVHRRYSEGRGQAVLRAHAVPRDARELLRAVRADRHAAGGRGDGRRRVHERVPAVLPVLADREQGAAHHRLVRGPRVRRGLHAARRGELDLPAGDHGAGGRGARAEPQHRQVRDAAAERGEVHQDVGVDDQEGEGGVRRVQ